MNTKFEKQKEEKKASRNQSTPKLAWNWHQASQQNLGINN